MTRSKKLVFAGGGALATVLIAVLLTPLLFADRIEARVRAEIERATRVQVSWANADVGLLGDFPHPSLRLSGLTVVGTGRFEADTLAAVGEAAVSLDGRSLFGALRGRRPLVVRSIRLAAPRLRLKAEDDGTSNWDVVPEGPDDARAAAGSGAALSVSLRRFEITDGEIRIDDAPSGSLLDMRGLSHSLRGDFSRASLQASTRTHADAVTLRFAGTPYLSGVALDFDGDLDVDMDPASVQLADNRLRLNDLELRLDGSLARSPDGLDLDLAFDAPSAEFGSLLSLASMLYERDFSTLQTAGTFALDGSVRGRYAPDDFPALTLSVRVDDGSFRYPDLPLPARAISADLSVTNPGGAVDSTVVDLSSLHVEVGEETVDASVVLRTPVSDPEVDLRVLGTVDLGDVARTVKVAAAGDVAGVVVANAALHARLSDVDSARYERIEAQGTVSATGVELRGEALRHPVAIRDMQLALSPQVAELRSFDATFGSSDVQATGRLYDLAGFLLGGRPLRGTGQFTSRRLLLDEWRSGRELSAIPVPQNLDLSLEGRIERLELNEVEASQARGRVVVRDQRLTFENFEMQTLGGRIAVDGYYETADLERPTFAVALDLDSLDVTQSSAAVLSFRRLVPIAQYAQGTFTTDLMLTGVLGQDLSPDLDVLEGDGSFATSPMVVQGFPILEGLSERLDLQRLSNPTIESIGSGIQIERGRLMVHPFRVDVGGLGMAVTGSNGIDQSIDYGLTLEVPRSGLTATALDALGSRTGPLGARLASLDPVPVRVRVTGQIQEPSFEISLDDAARSVRSAVETTVTDATTEAVQREIDEARARADAAEAAARREAEARADSIVAEAERQAEAIRAEAAELAAEVRAQGDRAAAELMARASNPLERAAAQRAADRVRSEAEDRATQIERQADARATELVEEARARAETIRGGG